ncbi:tryptophan-rich sensory protein [Sphingomonas baiyangensis]|uniref:Tryptophan-rich sensory protein n=1 Tax=Sphingomonas baiyangensis TaxID=2572576 RepID=A0A4U1L7E1_9SPHN|nr:tryptophan-rich sensory protein [Sphingomonas baiyangensis]
MFPVIVASMAAALVAMLGATMTDLGPWYRSLAKPGWAPPDLAYPVVWTAVFALTALAGVTAWRHARSRAAVDWLVALAALNGFLNILWSMLFFRLARPDWAGVEVVALIASTAALLWVAARQSRTAGLMLLPYLAWVMVAALLNWEIVRLNGPFG